MNRLRVKQSSAVPAIIIPRVLNTRIILEEIADSFISHSKFFNSK
jgi:hypothetical protein